MFHVGIRKNTVHKRVTWYPLLPIHGSEGWRFEVALSGRILAVHCLCPFILLATTVPMGSSVFQRVDGSDNSMLHLSISVLTFGKSRKRHELRPEFPSDRLPQSYPLLFYSTKMYSTSEDYIILGTTCTRCLRPAQMTLKALILCHKH